MNDDYKNCDNCYYMNFDSCAFPCSMCIRGQEREDQWKLAEIIIPIDTLRAYFESQKPKRQTEPSTAAIRFLQRMDEITRRWK